ncbi:hypothetical protein C5E24_06785 [Pectobacterium parmentieri]|uniref:hypothetical protein n=1 Tax=Pectobacterium parmentieri TaxID=1905730 RepID=UPI000EB54DDF|nr:hypothetical protein [Pectobacterium parmentieri]AYH09415.1 hypothetical protein C5E24_06785 [Pectobacterium parmentieri]
MSNFKFAHLLGLKKKASEEDDDKEKGKKAKSRRAEEERDDEEDAEDDDDREDMEDDDREPDAEDDDGDKEKGKKAKSRRAEEDDEDAEEDENSDVKKGRRAERKRCAAIFGSKHAAGRPDMAAHLAFNTRMSASEAIDTMATMGAVAPVKSARASLDERMQDEKVRLGPDSGNPSTGKKSLVSKMTSLYDSARGNK